MPRSAPSKNNINKTGKDGGLQGGEADTDTDTDIEAQ